MAWQVHRESKWWVVDENVAKTLANRPQAREVREVKPKGTDTQSTLAQAGCG